MTVNRGLALILTVVAAGARVNAATPPGTTVTPRLTAISARVHAKGAALVIEASEPVAYTTSRPDPLTLLLDFRNVAAADVANSVAADVKSPIAHVSIESAESLGAPASRVTSRCRSPSRIACAASATPSSSTSRRRPPAARRSCCRRRRAPPVVRPTR